MISRNSTKLHTNNLSYTTFYYKYLMLSPMNHLALPSLKSFQWYPFKDSNMPLCTYNPNQDR
jgi:hypothetical protein